MIAPPPRSTVAGSAIILAATALLLVFLLLPSNMDSSLLFTATILVLAAVWFKQAQAVHISLFSLLWILTCTMAPGLKWPFHMFLPIVGYAVCVWSVPGLRASLLWIHPGRQGTDIRLLVLATILLSGAGLLLWYFLARPNLAVFFELLPEMPVGIIPIAGLFFAILNAVMEESVFRGVLMQSLESALGAGMPVVLIQATLFGVLHYPPGALPSGVWGVGMTFVYGVMLGLIRERARGMLAPVVAHILADAVVFAIVAGVSLSG